MSLIFNVSAANVLIKKLKYKYSHTNLRLNKSFFKDALLIIMGVLSAGFGLKGFILTGLFIDGGVTGVSLLVSELSGIPLYYLIILINLPFIYLGYRSFPKAFVIRTILAIILLSLVIAFVEFPIVTQDKLLISIFGGFFLGMGIGLSVRGNAVIDGTEIFALAVSRRTGFSIGDIILIINIIIFSAAAALLSVERALYSILVYIAASRTVDYVITGIDEYMGITIISDMNNTIRRLLTDDFGIGVTVYAGRGGYGERGVNTKNKDILFTITTRLELGKLTAAIKNIDKDAFLIVHNIHDTKGGMIKKTMDLEEMLSEKE